MIFYSDFTVHELCKTMYEEGFIIFFPERLGTFKYRLFDFSERTNVAFSLLWWSEVITGNDVTPELSVPVQVGKPFCNNNTGQGHC